MIMIKKGAWAKIAQRKLDFVSNRKIFRGWNDIRIIRHSKKSIACGVGGP
jgi:hypothetical protein